jgi:hypothetical protein
VAGCCEHGNEPSGSIKGEEFLDYLSDFVSKEGLLFHGMSYLLTPMTMSNNITRVYPKVSGLSHNEVYGYNNKHSLRSNKKGYDGKTHQTDLQNSDITARSGRELCHLQFSFQAISPETSGYTVVH